LQHISGNKSNIKLQRALKKYGLHLFNFFVFELYPKGSGDTKEHRHSNIPEGARLSLTDIETIYILSYPAESLYNIKRIANSLKGYKHTAKSRDKMVKRFIRTPHPLLGKSHSAETIAKIAESSRGKTMARVRGYGVKHSEETKLKIGFIRRSHILVHLYDINKTYIRTFKSSNEAAEILNVSKYVIYRAIKNHSTIAGKYLLSPAYASLFITNKKRSLESELVAGFFTEHSSIIFVFFFLGEYCSIVLMSTLAAILFTGGWLMPEIFVNDTVINLQSIILGIKTCLFCFMFVWFRATLPRLRYDQLILFCWTGLLPVVIALTILAPSILVAFDVAPY
jgi:group I intron endonuclease